MHKAIIAVIGPSGTGKSTSLRNLDPATTRIIDLERKGFPFRDATKFKVIPCNNIAEVDKAVDECLKDQTVKVIVVESITKYFEMLLRFAKQAYKNYDIYAYYNKVVGMFLDKIKNDHAYVIITGIDEIVKVPQVDGSETALRRLHTFGKEWEGKIEKEFLMVFFTDVRKDKDNKIVYNFQTNTDGVTSAKSPMGMFDEQLIPNDLAYALTQLEKYYHTDNVQNSTPVTTIPYK